MRVATNTIFDSTILNLDRTSSDMTNASEVVSSGKRINKPSDDPVGIVTALGLRASLSDLDQMKRNISTGTSFLNASESALTQVNNILTSAKSLTVQMSSATETATDRSNSVGVVDGYLNQILSLANTSSAGRYIFGGTNTATAPFSLSEDGSQVNYSGNDTAFSINIGKDTNMAIGEVGKDIFGDGNSGNNNIFKTLIDLKTSLQTNDVSGIQDAMTKLGDDMTSINASVSEIGGKLTNINVKQTAITDLETTDTNRDSQIEDADISEAVTQLQSKQLAYNAALVASSKILQQKSLVDYL